VSVVYLMGYRQSGTTIIAALLGEIDGILNVGEMHHVWGHRYRGWPNCGCGSSVSECEHWDRILRDALSTSGFEPLGEPGRVVNRFDPRTVASVRADWLEHWRGLARRARRGAGDEHPYVELTANLYRAAAAATGSRVLIDASKKGAYAALLDQMDGVQSHVVHITRDPRGTLWSQLRRPSKRSTRKERGARVMGRVAKGWLQSNLECEYVLRHQMRGDAIRLRYEDVMADPETHLRSVAALAGVTARGLPLVESHVAMLRASHTPAGNARVRFRTGSVELRVDDAWKDHLTPLQRRGITIATAPLLRRYGYGRAVSSDS
jgi:Sulfotransferase family